MKTVVVIVSPVSKAGEIEDIKDKIIKYLGSRMVEQIPDDVPGLILNQTLDIMDKTAVSDIVCNSDDRSVVLFMETDKDTLPNDNYYVFEI